MDAPDEALYCPTCSYNLTGLLENRCPECGNHFDFERAKPLSIVHFRPVGLGGVLLHLLVPPLVFMLSVQIGVVLPVIGVAAMIGGGLFWLVVSIINARKIAWRLAANRAAARGRPVALRSDVPFVIGVGSGLWVCQFFLGFCGCTLVVITS